MIYDRLLLRFENPWTDMGIELVIGRAVILLRHDLKLALRDGSCLSCTGVALTTGADVIRLPEEMGGTLDGVLTISLLQSGAGKLDGGANALIGSASTNISPPMIA